MSRLAATARNTGPSARVPGTRAEHVAADPWQDTQFNATAIIYGDHRVFALDYDGTNRIVEARSDAACPGDLFLLTRSGEGAWEERRLTDVNRDFLAGKRLAT